MSYFSELLTFYSKRIGVNSPLIASYCGLDRVTVYRFLKGKTLPKDKDTVSKMAEFLQLTSDEKGTLAEAYECSRLGSHVYWERRYIRSFIRSFSGIIPAIPMVQFDTDHLEDLHGETLVLCERNKTIMRIQKEILLECERPQCEINLRMSACINIIMDMLLAAGKRNSSLKIKHLIPITITSVYENDGTASNKNVFIPTASYTSIGEPFNPSFFAHSMYIPLEAENRIREAKSSSRFTSDSVWIGEHELLQNIFKVVRLCAEGFDYEPSYYYTRQEEIGQFPVYTNLLITQGAAILFTDDLRESIVLSDPKHVAVFRKKYKALMEDKPQLFFFFQNVETLIKNATNTIINRSRKLEETEYYYSSLPCILPVLTNDILEKHLCVDSISAKGSEERVLKIIDRYVASIRSRYTGDDFNEITFLTESGLRAFMKTGRFSDVPPELYSPLSEPERREMLLAIADHPHLKSYVLKNELSAPEGMLGIEVMDNTLFISFYTPGKGMCFFNINESGVLMAFRNFFKDFPRNELYSEEESRKIIRAIAGEPL